MTRTKPTDLGDGVAEAIFRLHVPLDLSPKTLWQYEMKNGKAKVQWANIMKARPLLSDVLDKSGGRSLRQSRLHKQFKDFLLSRGVHWSISDTEAPIFRLRTMLSCLLKCKTSNRKPPRAYESLSTLLNKIHVSENEDEQNNEEQSVEEVPTPAYMPEVAEVVLVSSQESTAPMTTDGKYVDETEIDEIEKKLFASPCQPQHIDVVKTPSPKAPRPSSASTGEKPMQLLTPEQLAAVIGGCQSVGPVPQEYRTKKMKKPAAADPVDNRSRQMKRPAAAKVEQENFEAEETSQPAAEHEPTTVTSDGKGESGSKESEGEASERSTKTPRIRKTLGKHFTIAELAAAYPVVDRSKLKAMQKLVHSRLWHAEDDRGKANGVDCDERHAAATRAAKEGVQQWLQIVGF
jgi:hypothetical protein